MRKPSTNFKWVDTEGASTNAPVLEVRPLFLTASSFDQGPEEVTRVYGNNFYKLFGQNISFARHGQPAIQAANIIDNGGELLIKRVVADDALLANLVLVAKVSQGTTEKIDSVTGKPVYIDSTTGKETLDATNSEKVPNNKAIVNTAVIKYEVVNTTDAKKVADVKAFANSLAGMTTNDTEVENVVEVSIKLTTGGDAPKRGDVVGNIQNGIGEALVGSAEVSDDDIAEQYLPVGTVVKDTSSKLFKVIESNKVEEIPTEQVEYTFPLLYVADNGRGDSNKRFSISCNYTLSKSVGFAMYELKYLGYDNFDAETIRFSIDPTKIYAGRSYALSMTGKDSIQLRLGETDYLEEFVEKVSEFTGIELDELINLDVLFGFDQKGNDISAIQTKHADESGNDVWNGFDIASDSFLLLGGSNGSFGKAPFGTSGYEQKLIEFYDGTFDDVVFDKDQNKIEVCLDANYPENVKDAISTLADYREDFVFFRDYGLNNDSYDAIELQCSRIANEHKTKFNKEYYTTYDVIDKFTRKQVKVTILYSFARLLVSHLNKNRTAPFMGIKYGVTIPEAIEGTVNFIPKETPFVDQKTLLIENHINYATMINGVLTVETDMTSQVKENQCSYGNNILTVQQTIRKIRTICPKLRGTFIETSDSLDKYAQKIRDVIMQDKDNYGSIEFVYTADEIMKANHVFDASLRVTFKNFVGSEDFTVYTLE